MLKKLIYQTKSHHGKNVYWLKPKQGHPAIENEFAAAAEEDARSGMSKEQIRTRGM